MRSRIAYVISVIFLLFSLSSLYSESEQAKAVIAQFQQNSWMFDLPVDQVKAIWSQMEQTFPDVHSDVIFIKKKIGGIDCEIIKSRNSEPGKIVLYFHGGGFIMGSPRAYRDMNSRLAKLDNIEIISVDYRLAPEYPFPAGLDDCLQVYKTLLNTGNRPENIVFMGDSAGGTLVFTVMLKAKEQNLPLPAAGVAISPWTDLACTAETFIKNEATEAFSFIKSNVKLAYYYMYGYNNNPANTYVSPTNPLISPLYADVVGLPPFYITASSFETLQDDSIRIFNKLSTAHVNAVLEQVVGQPHVYPAFGYFIPEGQESLQRIALFIKNRLNIIDKDKEHGHDRDRNR